MADPSNGRINLDDLYKYHPNWWDALVDIGTYLDSQMIRSLDTRYTGELLSHYEFESEVKKTGGRYKNKTSEYERQHNVNLYTNYVGEFSDDAGDYGEEIWAPKIELADYLIWGVMIELARQGISDSEARIGAINHVLSNFLSSEPRFPPYVYKEIDLRPVAPQLYTGAQQGAVAPQLYETQPRTFTTPNQLQQRNQAIAIAETWVIEQTEFTEEAPEYFTPLRFGEAVIEGQGRAEHGPSGTRMHPAKMEAEIIRALGKDQLLHLEPWRFDMGENPYRDVAIGNQTFEWEALQNYYSGSYGYIRSDMSHILGATGDEWTEKITSYTERNLTSQQDPNIALNTPLTFNDWQIGREAVQTRETLLAEQKEFLDNIKNNPSSIIDYFYGNPSFNVVQTSPFHSDQRMSLDDAELHIDALTQRRNFLRAQGESTAELDQDIKELKANLWRYATPEEIRLGRAFRPSPGEMVLQHQQGIVGAPTYSQMFDPVTGLAGGVEDSPEARQDFKEFDKEIRDQVNNWVQLQVGKEEWDVYDLLQYVQPIMRSSYAELVAKDTARIELRHQEDLLNQMDRAIKRIENITTSDIMRLNQEAVRAGTALIYTPEQVDRIFQNLQTSGENLRKWHTNQTSDLAEGPLDLEVALSHMPSGMIDWTADDLDAEADSLVKAYIEPTATWAGTFEEQRAKYEEARKYAGASEPDVIFDHLKKLGVITDDMPDYEKQRLVDVGLRAVNDARLGHQVADPTPEEIRTGRVAPRPGIDPQGVLEGVFGITRSRPGYVAAPEVEYGFRDRPEQPTPEGIASVRYGSPGAEQPAVTGQGQYTQEGQAFGFAPETGMQRDILRAGSAGIGGFQYEQQTDPNDIAFAVTEAAAPIEYSDYSGKVPQAPTPYVTRTAITAARVEAALTDSAFALREKGAATLDPGVAAQIESEKGYKPGTLSDAATAGVKSKEQFDKWVKGSGLDITPTPEEERYEPVFRHLAQKDPKLWAEMEAVRTGAYAPSQDMFLRAARDASGGDNFIFNNLLGRGNQLMQEYAQTQASDRQKFEQEVMSGYLKDPIGMTPTEARHFIRPTGGRTSFEDFLQTRMPEELKMVELMRPFDEPEEDIFQRGLTQAQRSARVSQAMREDPIFRTPRRGRTVVI